MMGLLLGESPVIPKHEWCLAFPNVHMAAFYGGHFLNVLEKEKGDSKV